MEGCRLVNELNGLLVKDPEVADGGAPIAAGEAAERVAAKLDSMNETFEEEEGINKDTSGTKGCTLAIWNENCTSQGTQAFQASWYTLLQTAPRGPPAPSFSETSLHPGHQRRCFLSTKDPFFSF